ncbi:hypothetical protein Goklo_024173, partial [Gossypium klotzschianum]|nr:hypothetical protein [Gossypium klotzschianum]
MTMDDRCSLCGVEVENMDHVLQSCIVAPVIWKRLLESILEVSLRMQQQYTFAMESLEDSLVPVRHWKRNFGVLLKAFDLPGGVDRE